MVAREKKAEIMEMLLDAGLNVNAKNIVRIPILTLLIVRKDAPDRGFNP